MLDGGSGLKAVVRCGAAPHNSSNVRSGLEAAVRFRAASIGLMNVRSGLEAAIPVKAPIDFFAENQPFAAGQQHHIV
ncbi:MAG: hypothetical protein OER56_02080 [Hyphomicrobiales bacterium]|nr:hypothetical protein [Hyphomicrobiales bacterium]